MPFMKAWDWQAAYCCRACGDTLSAGRRPPGCPPRSVLPATGPGRSSPLPAPAPPLPVPPPAPPRHGPYRVLGGHAVLHPPQPQGDHGGADGPSAGEAPRPRPFRRCRHGGAGRALPPAAGRAGPAPLLLPARARPRRHRLCDRRAGGLGRGARRPPAARLQLPARGARLQAQGGLGAGGCGAEPGGGSGHAAVAGGGGPVLPVLGAGSLQAARRRGEEAAAGADVRHGQAHREPGGALGSGGDTGIFLQP